MTSADLPVPVRGLALLAILLGACAVPPTADGAPCPCPTGYGCDEAVGRCVAGYSPPVDPPLGRTCSVLGPSPTRPLSPSEYRNSVADLLGVSLPEGELPASVPGSNGFANSAERTGHLEDLRRLARVVAERAAPALGQILDCDRAAKGDAACAREFVDGFGRRVFRHPLGEAERSMLLAAQASGAASGGFEAGILRVIETALGADAFLLRRDRGLPAEPGATLVDLTPFEIAGRLSFLLWASTPDDALLTAAASGELATRAGRLAQARRLLADPRAERTVLDYHRQWMELEPDDVGRGGEELGFDPALRASVLRSGEEFVRRLVVQDDADLRSLLTTPKVFADARMASFYGLTAPAAPFEPVMPQGGHQRLGLLTLPARVALRGDGETPRPVMRGLWMNERLLCVTFPDAPTVIPAVPPVDLNLSTRQRYEQHRQSSCLGCHARMDALGFALDNYDGMGRWRTKDGIYDVDASGEVDDLRWQGPADLAPQLAASAQVQECVALQWFRYAFGREETRDGTDACTLQALERAFRAGGFRTRALLEGIVASDAFTAIPVTP